MDGLLKGPDAPMVDSLRAVHPNAEGRFTCWDQSTNKRYENEGKRLDYIFVDKILAPYIVGADVPLPCGNPNKLPQPLSIAYADTAAAAISAATYSGELKAAPKGINDPSLAVIRSQFEQTNSTGIVYTPPTFSDHAAIICFLRVPKTALQEWWVATLEAKPVLSDAESEALDAEEAKASKACQPHKAQSTLKFPPAEKRENGGDAHSDSHQGKKSRTSDDRK
jgi:hypothetical protein